MGRTKGKSKKARRIILLSVPLLLTAAFLLYTGRYYRAQEEAVRALASDSVTVEETNFGWFFDGPGSDSAFIFYPGGKVEAAAYAPLLHAVAGRGMDAFLVKVPFRLAFFGIDRAGQIQKAYDYENWYVGGHSLGGVAAAEYAADHELKGLILLAAYPVREVDEPVLIIYGSEDGVLNLKRVSEASRYGAVEEIVISGGNHAAFGNYGEQAGDGAAAISSDRQQAETVEAIAAWAEQHS